MWTFKKNVVYKTPPNNIPELKRRIVECERFTPEKVQYVREQFELRHYHYLTNIGGHLEHLT